MPRIIVTSRYLKSSSSKQLSHFVQYIATRESVEFYLPKEKNTPATEKQTELINSLLKEFPNGRNSLEYDDYKEKPTSENASELISEIIARNADIIGNKENFVGYMAMRPGAEKIGTHGLFSQTDEEIVLSNVAKEVAEHKGNVWTHVISLKREDAERLGYNNAEAWRQLVRRHIQTVAEATKIDMHNLKWYAAFHNTTHHPHIHLLVYSTNIRQGYLNQSGIESIRSSFANDIFQDELQHLYQEQTQTRDLLKAEANKFMKELSKNISDGNFENERLEQLILKLSDQLKTVSGKKVYGYLPKAMKATVDEILTELSKNETIAKMYEIWCSLEKDKLKTYSSVEKEILPIVNQKAFKSIKNIIIAEVLSMNSAISGFDIAQADDFFELPELNEQGNDFPSDDWPAEQSDSLESENIESDNIDKTTMFIEWSDTYKQACGYLYGTKGFEKNYDKALELFQSESLKGNLLAVYDIGKMYAQGLFGADEAEKANKYFKNALYGFAQLEPTAKKLRSYVQYRIGKLYNLGYGIEQNYSKAFEWFGKSASQGNKFAQYSLGSLYYYGSGVEQNYEKAFQYYMLSANQGNAYACYEVGKMLSSSQGTSENAEESYAYFQSAYNGFLKIEQDLADDKLWYRLGQICLNGIGCEVNTKKALNYFIKSAEVGNSNAQYELGKQYILGEITKQNIEKGLDFLTKSAESNTNSQYFLGKLSLDGNVISQDIDKAIGWLTKSAENKNPIAAYRLGKIYLTGEYIISNYKQAEKWFKLSAEQNNEYAQYALGKLYLDENYRDYSLAEHWLTKSSDQGNSYAMLYLARLYLSGEIPKDIEKAMELLRQSTEKENNSASYTLGKLYLYGKDIPQDIEQTKYWLNLSSNQGNEYAKPLLSRMDSSQSPSAFSLAISLLQNLSRIIAGDYNQNWYSNKLMVDRKLKRAIARKKQALGIKEDHTISQGGVSY